MKLQRTRLNQMKIGRKFWINCVMDEKDLGKVHFMGHISFFDAERYTKKQMIAFAKSIHLKQGRR